MAQNVHACKIERFRFFWRKAVKHGKDSEFQKSLERFWKQSIDKHLCQMCALSSYQFLRSILKKERRTWFEKRPIFCTFLRRNLTQLYNFDGFYYQLRGWSWILSNSFHQQIHLRLNSMMAKIGVVRKWLTSFGFDALEKMERCLLFFLFPDAFLSTEEPSEVMNRSGKSPFSATKSLLVHIHYGSLTWRWAPIWELRPVIKSTLCKTDLLLSSALCQSSLGIEKRRQKSFLSAQGLGAWIRKRIPTVYMQNFFHPYLSFPNCT